MDNRKQILVSCLAILLLRGKPIKNEKLRRLIERLVND
jgi:hypothetical protein